MLSPYRIQSKNINKRTKKASNTKFLNISNGETDVKRLQMTLNEFNTSQTNTKSNTKNKNTRKARSVHKKVEINEHYLDGVLDRYDI